MSDQCYMRIVDIIDSAINTCDEVIFLIYIFFLLLIALTLFIKFTFNKLADNNF